MKIVIGNVYFVDGNKNQAVIVTAKTKRKITYMFVDMDGRLHTGERMSRVGFERYYKKEMK